jgi:hypothetical protein
MPIYQVVASERWGIRVTYDVDAPNEHQAVRMVKDQEVEVETYSVNWEDHMEVDEILVVSDEGGCIDVAQFNQPELPEPTAHIYQRVATDAQLDEPQRRTLRDLSQDSLDVQDACNLCGVARSFAEVCVELKNWPHQTGDFREKRDAITKMWISKLEHLTGLDQSMTQVDYDIVYNLAHSA